MIQYVYCVFICIILFVHLTMMRNERIRDKGVGVYSATFLMMIVYFEVIPIIYFLSSTDNMSSSQKMVHDSSILQFVFAEIAVIIFTFFFHYSYRRYNNYNKRVVYGISEEKLDKVLKILVVATFLIGGLAMVVYISAFGGVLSLLEKANYLRSFATSSTEFVTYYASLLVIPARLITVTPILVVSLIKKNKKKVDIY